MSRLKLAIHLGFPELPLKRGLAEARRLEVQGVQIDAQGELSPEALSGTGRRELAKRLKALDLGLSAVGCPLRHGLGAPENQGARIEHIQRVMTLSYDLGSRLVIVRAGRIPRDEHDPAQRWMRDALEALGRHGDRTGTVLALGTGMEPTDGLAGYLSEFDSGGLAANLDPALLLIHGHDPYASIRGLARHIAHVHASDARRTDNGAAGLEVPLGDGELDWMRLLAALEEVGYRGYLTVTRSGGPDRLGDMARGVVLLRRLGV